VAGWTCAKVTRSSRSADQLRRGCEQSTVRDHGLVPLKARCITSRSTFRSTNIGGNVINKLTRLITVIAVAVAAATVALVPSPASAAVAPVLQTAPATCRANLAAPNSVLIIGDSIISGWFAATTAQFTAAHRRVCVNAQPGRLTAGAVSVLAGYKAEGIITANTTVVMAIGSNDT
jgi:hypothetical protein